MRMPRQEKRRSAGSPQLPLRLSRSPRSSFSSLPSLLSSLLSLSLLSLSLLSLSVSSPLFSLAFEEAVDVEVCEGRILGGGGVSLENVDLSDITVSLVTDDGIVKETEHCSPTGYYLIRLDSALPQRHGRQKKPFSLHVSGPPGWSFSPPSFRVADGNCHQDMNFLFTGFRVSGKVVAAGSEKGPANLSVALHSASQASGVSTVQTEEGGNFAFSPVLPGTFSLVVSFPGVSPAASAARFENGGKLRISVDQKGQARVLDSPQKKTTETGPREIVFRLTGYRLEGRVVDPRGRPLPRPVVVELRPKAACDLSLNCGLPPLPPALSAFVRRQLHSPSSSPSCFAVADSRKEGNFAFPAVPACTYLVRPLSALPGVEADEGEGEKGKEDAEGDRDERQVVFSPEEHTFDMTEADVQSAVILPEFKLAKMTITSRVVSSGEHTASSDPHATVRAVPGASVLFRRDSTGAVERTESDEEGKFSFSLAAAGETDLSFTATKDRYGFTTVFAGSLSWETRNALPPIEVSSVDICGNVEPASKFVSFQGLTVFVKPINGDEHSDAVPQQAVTDEWGKFCVRVRPFHTYMISLFFPPEDASHAPWKFERVIEVVGEPLLDLVLREHRYAVQGSISCLEETAETGGRGRGEGVSTGESETEELRLRGLCGEGRLKVRVTKTAGGAQELTAENAEEEETRATALEGRDSEESRQEPLVAVAPVRRKSDRPGEKRELVFSVTDLPGGVYTLEILELDEENQLTLAPEKRDSRALCWEKKRQVISFSVQSPSAPDGPGPVSVHFTQKGYRVYGTSNFSFSAKLLPSSAGSPSDVEIPLGRFALCLGPLSGVYTLSPVAADLRLAATPLSVRRAVRERFGENGQASPLRVHVEEREVRAVVVVSGFSADPPSPTSGKAGSAGVLYKADVPSLVFRVNVDLSSASEKPASQTVSCAFSRFSSSAAEDVASLLPLAGDSTPVAVFHCPFWMRVSDEGSFVLSLSPPSLPDGGFVVFPENPLNVSQVRGGTPAPAAFVAERQCVVRGKVVPPVANVKVSFAAKGGNKTVSPPALTGPDGRFASHAFVCRTSLWPGQKVEQVEVVPSHHGYRFARQPNRGEEIFRATKLASVTVKVSVTPSEGLRNVLISFSPLKDSSVRPSRQLTNADGEALFVPSFSDGEKVGLFRLKPMLKGFRFEPQFLDVAVEPEGGKGLKPDKVVAFRATKILYDCSGHVRLLSPRQLLADVSKHREPLAVKATGKSPAGAVHTEEASVEEDGSFLLRGLWPGVAYEVFVASSGARRDAAEREDNEEQSERGRFTLLSGWERAAPVSRQVHRDTVQDVTGVDFIVFPSNRGASLLVSLPPSALPSSLSSSLASSSFSLASAAHDAALFLRLTKVAGEESPDGQQNTRSARLSAVRFAEFSGLSFGEYLLSVELEDAILYRQQISISPRTLRDSPDGRVYVELPVLRGERARNTPDGDEGAETQMGVRGSFAFLLAAFFLVGIGGMMIRWQIPLLGFGDAKKKK
uniref:Nodal modulator 1, putative n=1 Tax=Neospora caninum (strain Liverpool) TaxID=572307 RepID=A0A0F7U782_NEOCL|nr:TPA: Nodal modulator 1, putative [Neospora caninum Liverpool]